MQYNVILIKDIPFIQQTFQHKKNKKTSYFYCRYMYAVLCWKKLLWIAISIALKDMEFHYLTKMVNQQKAVTTITVIHNFLLPPLRQKCNISIEIHHLKNNLIHNSKYPLMRAMWYFELDSYNNFQIYFLKIHYWIK